MESNKDEIPVKFMESIEHIHNSNLTFYSKCLFINFMLIWAIIIYYNNLNESYASYVLLIPLFYFFVGFLNSECICDKKIEDDVLSVTFIGYGIIFSMPLLALFNKDKINPKLNKIVFLAVTLLLLTYPHIWGGSEIRHLYKIYRSCMETMGVTLYIYAMFLYGLQFFT